MHKNTSEIINKSKKQVPLSRPIRSHIYDDNVMSLTNLP